MSKLGCRMGKAVQVKGKFATCGGISIGEEAKDIPVDEYTLQVLQIRWSSNR